MTATPATLVRFRAGDGACTYAAVRASDALEVIGDWLSDGLGDADTIPWDVLPGAEQTVTRQLATQGRRTVLIIGTTEGGGWGTWHLPVSPPPVPEDTP